MPIVDLVDPELSAYQSSAVPPNDLLEFWNETIAESRAMATPPTLVPVGTGLRLVQTWDVTFSGYGGQPIRAWYHRPAGLADEKLPVVIRYVGYGGGRGLPHQSSIWVDAGFGHLVMDTRGQGSSWSPGDTADPVGSDPAAPGSMTQGITDPATYYYRRVFTDAVLAVDLVHSLDGVDPTRVVVTGMSQGGGIALAVAGLTRGLAAVMADVPFLCDYRRGVNLAQTPPYSEIGEYLRAHPDHVERVFRTLAYFDASLLAAWASSPALFSVAEMDRTCPPSTVFAAFNAYAGPKEIRRYAFNDHEGGQGFHEREQLRWLPATLGLA